ncbi:MAG: fused MFS/spermidine synthase [Pyrinomonadaceae bacterium]
MSTLFAITLFVSAFLLFWAEPLIAKMLLPLMGGTPTVWNTCMLFFQGMLLAGYAYALAVTKWLDTRGQLFVHALLLATAALFLPVVISAAAWSDVPAAQSNPVPWLLWRLLLTTGLPFFVVSSSAPLLQKWFSQTRGASAGDPYFLYAASNAGSLCALIAFPLALESSLTLRQQENFWAWAYAALAALFLSCAVVLWRSASLAAGSGPSRHASTDSSVVEGRTQNETRAATITPRQRLRWTLLAFVPSSLVLGVTTYITTDVTAVPLLWVIPLALYLLTFVLAFARGRVLPLASAARILPGAAVILTLVYLSGAVQPAWFFVLVHLLFFFVAAYVCHAQLADERPAAHGLAEFYLWLAVGGALGGVFNALIAPLIFNSIVEYPLLIVVACFLRPLPEARGAERKGFLRHFTLKTLPREPPSATQEKSARQLDYLLPVAMGALTVALSLAVMPLEMLTIAKVAVVVGVPLFLLNHFFKRRRLRFALGLAAIMLGSLVFTESSSTTLRAERNFYGTLRVSLNDSETLHTLRYGSTLHGRQLLDPARQCEPLSYYHQEGPLGSVFEAFNKRATSSGNVAVVGLGTGASAAYATAGQNWTFYEINPAVVRIARDPNYFTYLQTCARAPVSVVLGDARLKLRDAADGSYDLIILDAFSSDAIPAHLLTREALALYVSKLATGGFIAFHLSNRTLDLNAVIGGLTRDANLSALGFNDPGHDTVSGRDPSHWVVVARRTEDLRPLDADARWHPPDEAKHNFVVWTDDFSNIVSVFKWL